MSFRDFLGEALVLFFYPKDDTPRCTREAAFRDEYEQFSELDTEVIGISSDSVDSHKSFAEGTIFPLPYSATRGVGQKALWCS